MYKKIRIRLDEQYRPLIIGRAGENLYRTLQVYIPGGIDEDAEYRIVYSRPDGATYPVAVSEQNGLITWEPDAYDTEVPGQGQIEVRTYYGDTIGKSATFKTEVLPSIQADYSQPQLSRPDWVDDIIDKVVISDMEQTVAAKYSGGVNVFKVRLSNGKSTAFRVHNGARGADGYTPQRGVDYWTEKDKQEIVRAVLAALAGNAHVEIKYRKGVGSAL